MSEFNRGLYAQGTKMESIKSTQQAAQKNDKRFYNDGNSFVGYHYPQEGKNVFRIAPAHNPADSPYVPVRYSQLEVEVDEYDKEGNKTGKKIWARRKCFVITQHGPHNDNNTSLIKNDPIESYIEFLQAKAEEQFKVESEKKNYLAPLRGYWEGDKFQWGILPETRTICYAWDNDWVLKQLELNKRWYQEMERISFNANSDGAYAIDIFSHIDQGIPLVIEKVINRDAKKSKTEYKVGKEGPDMMKRESWDDFFAKTKVDDQHLEELLGKKSLQELYFQNYKQSDYQKAIMGLQRFDDKFGFDLFSDPLFIGALERIEQQIKELIPEEEKEVDNDSKEEPKKEEKNVEVKSKQPTQPAQLSIPKKRNFIKAYINENYEIQFDVKILTKTEVEAWYELAFNSEDLPIEEYGKVEVEEKNDLPWEVDDANLADELNKLKKG